MNDFGVALALRHQPGEEFLGQQVDVLGKEAEEQADQVVGDGLRVVTPLAQMGGEAAKVAAASSVTWAEVICGRKASTLKKMLRSSFQPRRRQQVVERERNVVVDGVGEVGVDQQAAEVADDEQGRILQRLTVLEQLLVGRVQVGAGLLVLDGKATLVPDVGVALAALLLRDLLLEDEGLVVDVGVRGGGVIDQQAEVGDVRLVVADR